MGPDLGTRREELSATGDGRTIGELLAQRAREQPDKPFVIFPDDGETITYGEAYQQALRLAWALTELGLRPGDRVALAMPNTRQAVVSWFACLLAGLVDTAVNPELVGPALRYAIQKVAASAVIIDAAHLDALRECGALDGAAAPRVVCDGAAPSHPAEGPAAEFELSALAGSASETTLPRGGVTELASIRFTSGSTGMPKGIMMSQEHMRASARMFATITDLVSDDVLYSCFPLHHVLASITGVLAALEAGATMSLARKFSAQRYWPHIRSCGATVAHNLDPVVNILMKAEPAAADTDHQVRCMYTAAGAYPEFEKRFATRLLPLFDMSEITAAVRYRPGEPRREGSCGRESELFTVAIADERDRLLGPNEVGQILVRPKVPGVIFLGYYGDAEQTVQQWRNLWFHTGDLGYLDEDGYFYFTGRSADRIRHRGVNVSAAQVEAMVLERPEIAECAAIAVPSDLGEDDIKICVVAAEGARIDVPALGGWLTSTFPDHLCPRYLEVYPTLPRTDTEKVRKGVLRAQGSAGSAGASWDARRRGYLVSEKA